MRVIVALLWLAFTVLTEALVVVLLWRWFMVPFGVPALTVPHAIGLNVLIAVFIWRYIPTRPEDTPLKVLSWLTMVWLTTLVGFLASRWM